MPHHPTVFTGFPGFLHEPSPGWTVVHVEERPVNDAASTHLTVPSVDVVIDRAGGKFMAVTLAARRARQLGSYFAGHTLPDEVPPRVPPRSKHPLSIALDEVVSGTIVSRPVSREELLASINPPSAPPPVPEETPTAPEQ